MKQQHLSPFELLKNTWKDTPEFHETVNNNAIKEVNKDPQLKAYRDYIEAGAWGFGERSFTWMWNLILMGIEKESPHCLEIGVHRGAILALWKILKPKALCAGISPMNGAGLGFEGQDFSKDVDLLHQYFKITHPEIIKGYSTDRGIIEAASRLYPLDLLYIDGSHRYEDVKSDIINYSKLVVPGGIMVIDDCCNSFHMPWGYFQGIEEVTKAVDELLPPFTKNDEWEFLFSVVHNRIYKRR